MQYRRPVLTSAALRTFSRRVNWIRVGTVAMTGFFATLCDEGISRTWLCIVNVVPNKAMPKE